MRPLLVGLEKEPVLKRQPYARTKRQQELRLAHRGAPQHRARANSCARPALSAGGWNQAPQRPRSFPALQWEWFAGRSPWHPTPLKNPQGVVNPRTELWTPHQNSPRPRSSCQPLLHPKWVRGLSWTVLPPSRRLHTHHQSLRVVVSLGCARTPLSIQRFAKSAHAAVASSHSIERPQAATVAAPPGKPSPPHPPPVPRAAGRPPPQEE